MAQRQGKRRIFGMVGGLLSLGMVMAACGGDDESSTTAPEGAEPQAITIGWIPWDEDIAATHLWKKILEDKGYEVELTQVDVAPLYAGLAKGDVDLFLDGWLPVTHEDYWQQYGDQIEDLGIWYDNAKLTIAVPEYSDVTSIADLKGKADAFGGQIVGIEPGAGLTRVTKDEAMPTYGLTDEFTLVTSSTPAMLAELKKATDAQEDIVVTLWRPHWAYAQFPIKDLEDPEGTMGAAEEIHTFGRDGFAADFPEVAEMLKNFTMTDEQLGSLEHLVLNEYGEGKEAEAVEQWLSENPDFVSGLEG